MRVSFDPFRNLLPVAFRGLCTRPSVHTAGATRLAHELYRQINFHGPLSTAEYMRMCLTHPTYGYYTSSASIFGAGGDFITSPQISPIFGELIAVWVANYQSTVATTSLPYHLVELGPGTGSLLAAALPVLRKFKCEPASVTLVERSAILQKKQHETLQKVEGGAPPTLWVPSIDHVFSERPNERRIFLLHEFLDALPVHVFRRVQLDNQSVWREQLVDIDASRGEETAFRFVLAGTSTPALGLLQAFPPGEHEDIVEVGADAAGIVEGISKDIGENGGAAVVIDYGKDGWCGDTLRGFLKHEQVDVLHRPGECDMTVDVNFGDLRRAVQRVDGGENKVAMMGPVTQKTFLLSLGLAARFRKVGQSVIRSGEEKGESGDVIDAKLGRLQADYDRLVGDMGEAFKVAVIAGRNGGEIAGGFDK